MVLAGFFTAFVWSVLAAQTSATASGIVKRDGVRLLAQPSEDAIAGEVVREGERFAVIDRTGAFVRIQSLTGTLGWIRLRDVGAL